MKYQILTFKQGRITRSQLDDAVDPIIAYNTGQDLVITDININLANDFQATAQLSSNLYITK